MKTLAMGLAALAVAGPAAASDLGCWDTSNFSANPGTPSGSYLHSGSSIDYVAANNDGATGLLGSLSSYVAGEYVICMYGSSHTDYGDNYWELSEAIICPIGEYSTGSCPD
ncbi:MAG: hypothetical protein R3F55_06550 [Alphaproteobacteria bacterium]